MMSENNIVLTESANNIICHMFTHMPRSHRRSFTQCSYEVLVHVFSAAS